MEKLFDQVEARVAELVGQAAQDSPDASILHEIQVRTASLRSKYAPLMDINNRIRTLDPLSMDISMGPGTDELVVRVGGKEVSRLKFNRANPDVPVSMGESTMLGTFMPGRWDADDPAELMEAGKELAANLEQFYYEAHRVMKLIARLGGAKKTRIGGAGLVRNLLIEHPPDGALYSFGWSNRGPRVKPMGKGTLKHHDEGLVPNTEELLREMLRCLG